MLVLLLRFEVWKEGGKKKGEPCLFFASPVCAYDLLTVAMNNSAGQGCASLWSSIVLKVGEEFLTSKDTRKQSWTVWRCRLTEEIPRFL